MNNNVEKLYGMHEAAEYLGICYRTMQNIVYAREIGFVRIRKYYKFRETDLKKYLEKNYVKPVN